MASIDEIAELEKEIRKLRQDIFYVKTKIAGVRKSRTQHENKLYEAEQTLELTKNHLQYILFQEEAVPLLEYQRLTELIQKEEASRIKHSTELKIAKQQEKQFLNESKTIEERIEFLEKKLNNYGKITEFHDPKRDTGTNNQ